MTAVPEKSHPKKNSINWQKRNKNNRTLSNVYSPSELHLAPNELYLHHFGAIPHGVGIRNIQPLEMYNALKALHKNSILHEYKIQRYYAQKQELVDMSVCVFDTGEMLDLCQDKIVYYYTKESLFSINELKELSQHYLETDEKHENKIYILKDDGVKLRFCSFNINPPKGCHLDNYNTDFEDFDNRTKAILQSERNGLILLHGKPGTGKTSYLRHLISTIGKQVLYIPSGMAHQICNPQFISLLEDLEGSILIIEDAEDALLAREISGNNSAVSGLLNLTDGLLADVLNLRIICTFNTNLQNLDKALLRPGRLIGMYEFKELSAEKSQALLQKLGTKASISQPITLAEVYNFNTCESLKFERNAVGF